MTGNDIVDIRAAAAESNWKRKGFLEKVFTLQEQKYIRESVSPEKMVWRLWSMKESAYKIYTRQYGGRFFAPQKIHCTVLNGSSGIVQINNINYPAYTRSEKKYVYSITRAAESANIYINCCFRLPQQYRVNMEPFIHQKIITRYAAMSGNEKNNLSVIKDRKNIPFLYLRQADMSIPISITHHGTYAAFTIY